MNSMRVSCPCCAAAYDVDSGFVGRKLQCDRCGAKFYLEAAGDRVVTRAAIRCPGCGVEYAIEAELLGRQACCADCGTEFELACEAAPTA
ncbi:MAG: hypothetical protein BWZ02_01408 [Lentisphaerae bacterium ADurb.BinA184]|nr:MAG: hypothetical protein BWZ02_01408 [Lentisphaerae bacterium ADurb.BinA184]